MNQEEIDIQELKKTGYTYTLSNYFKELPPERKTLKVCQAAIKSNHHNLALIPTNLMNREICEYALDYFPISYNLFPRDYELFKCFVPYPELYSPIIKKYGNYPDIYKIVELLDPSLISPEVAKEILNKNFRCIALLPMTVMPEVSLQERKDIKRINSTLAFKLLPSQRKTEAVCYAVVLQNVINFKYVPEEVLSDRIIIRALQDDAKLFTKLKDKFKTEAVCIAAIRLAPLSRLIYNLPPKFLTDSVIITGLEYEPFFISTLNKKRLTNQMCLTAIEADCWTLLNIPLKMRTKEMYFQAVKNINSSYEGEDMEILKFIPDSQVCLSVLEEFRDAIDIKGIYKLIKKSVIDWDIATLMVTLDTKYYNLLPSKYKTQISQTELEDIRNIRQSDENIFSYLPEVRRTEIVSFAAVDKNGRYIIDVPKSVMTEKIIIKALKYNGDFITVIPPEKITDDMFLTAIQNSKSNITKRKLPPELLTPNNCMTAVKLCGYALKYIPDPLKNEEMCRTAFKTVTTNDFSEYKLLSYVPYSSVCLEKIKAYSDVIDIVDLITAISPKVIDKDIAEFCIGINGACFFKIPPDIQTKEMLITAIKVTGPSVLLNPDIRKDLLTNDILELTSQISQKSDLQHKITSNLIHHLEKIIPLPSKSSKNKSIQ